MKYLHIKTALILTVTMMGLLLLVAVRPVSAQESPDSEVTTQNDTPVSSERPEAPTNRGTMIAEQRKEVAKERLSAAKLRSCEAREANINAIMTRVSERSQRHIDRITTILDRAVAYYERQGIVAENYDVLYADAVGKKQSAQAALDTLAAQPDFSCESEGPQADIQSFRNQRLTKIEAIGDYRAAVKDLLVAIKAARSKEQN